MGKSADVWENEIASYRRSQIRCSISRSHVQYCVRKNIEPSYFDRLKYNREDFDFNYPTNIGRIEVYR